MRKILLLLSIILCTISCKPGKNPDPEEIKPAPSQPAYKVGDLYESNGIKGLIFKLNEDKVSGLIVSLEQPQTQLPWSSDLVVIGATSRTNGAENMAVIESIADWQSKYPAFVWCKSLGDGWYIPSVNELKELLFIGSSNTFKQAIAANKAAFFASGKYLSSTEMDQYWIYLVDYNTCIESGNYKQYTYNVRAIRAF